MLDNLVDKVMSSMGEKAKEITGMVEEVQKALKDMDFIGSVKKIGLEERLLLSSFSRSPLGIASKISPEIYFELISGCHQQYFRIHLKSMLGIHILAGRRQSH